MHYFVICILSYAYFIIITIIIIIIVIIIMITAEQKKILKMWDTVLLPLFPSFKQIFYPLHLTMPFFLLIFRAAYLLSNSEPMLLKD